MNEYTAEGFCEELEKLAGAEKKGLSWVKKALIGAGVAIPAVGGAAKLNKMENDKIKNQAMQSGYDIGREHGKYLSQYGQ